MIPLDREKFKDLCGEDRILHEHDGDSIGTYNEKRLHRILKRYITTDASCYEVKLGRYIADIVTEDTIYEIQTASFRALGAKVKYYLNETDKNVVLIHPVICEKTLIRADRESGEVLRVKRSPKKETDIAAVGNIYHLSESFPNERLCICLAHIKAEEYRFGEARRYCKSGRYDSDLRPCELMDIHTLSTKEHLRKIIPEELLTREFDTNEFSKTTKLKGRALYYSLGALCLADVLCKRKDGKKYIYKLKNG